MGSGTWTFNGGGVAFTIATTTNLTFDASAVTMAFNGSSTQTVAFADKFINAVTVGSRTTNFYADSSGSYSIGTLTLTAPLVVQMPNSQTVTITNLVAVGTSSNQITIRTGTVGTTSTISTSSALTCTYCAFSNIIRTGSGTLTAINSMNLGQNSGITFPGAGGCILGGWLLWRDMPEHLNDNFPAWLEKAS
jgi:hypothetical protein